MPDDLPVLPVKKLTRRERAVLTWVAAGLTNNEVGEELVITERTVQTHLSNIYTKLGVYNRTGAVVLAMVHGWVDGCQAAERIRERAGWLRCVSKYDWE